MCFQQIQSVSYLFFTMVTTGWKHFKMTQNVRRLTIVSAVSKAWLVLQIRSLDMLRTRFSSLPAAFVKHLAPSKSIQMYISLPLMDIQVFRCY